MIATSVHTQAHNWWDLLCVDALPKEGKKAYPGDNGAKIREKEMRVWDHQEIVFTRRVQ